MYAAMPKKLMIVNILSILQKYSDSDHRLSQKEIAELLDKHYNMKADRKAIKRNLMNLLDFGYEIAYSESVRKTKSGEDELVLTDWYLEREFEDSELRLLIDSILFSKNIPCGQRKELIHKIENLSNIYFSAKVKHICMMPTDTPTNKQLFYTIDVLDTAIGMHRQVSFQYCSYGMDKKLYPRTDENGMAKTYIVNPYQMTATNGRYYLICNYDKYDDLSNYRVDRIRNIVMLDAPAKPLKFANGIDLQKYMAEHIYMFSGESVRVKFRAKQYLLNDVIDYFGVEASFTEYGTDEMIVSVKINEEDMFRWAMQYADHVEVMEPLRLRKRVIAELKKSLEMYGVPF